MRVEKYSRDNQRSDDLSAASAGQGAKVSNGVDREKEADGKARCGSLPNSKSVASSPGTEYRPATTQDEGDASCSSSSVIGDSW